jgi:homogentisate 1,2-dioxygenase
MNAFAYMPGFGNDFETESLPGALPQGQNSPQKAITGSMPSSSRARPSPRRAATNERSWLYRIRPSVQAHDALQARGVFLLATAPHMPRRRRAARPVALGPDADPQRGVNFVRESAPSRRRATR